MFSDLAFPKGRFYIGMKQLTERFWPAPLALPSVAFPHVKCKWSHSCAVLLLFILFWFRGVWIPRSFLLVFVSEIAQTISVEQNRCLAA